MTPQSSANSPDVLIRSVHKEDLDRLVEIEQSTFTSDRLSRRRLKHWIKADNRVFVVAEMNQVLLGYGLVLLNQGTRLARLYSLAVDQKARGLGLGRKLLTALEDAAEDKERLYMRLEVAQDNASAITLYKSMGYRQFAYVSDYYEDHKDALRMQKCIRHPAAEVIEQHIPWYRQTTEFTCGPASLMMAMASLQKGFELTQEHELDIWRTATTIFMTSGHGGCHPVGLALAAHDYGYATEVYINQCETLFLDGVRTEKKKIVMTTVDNQFKNKANERGIPVHYEELSQTQIAELLAAGCAIVILISSYSFDGKKAPHWVMLVGVDDLCFYFHDPDPTDKNLEPIDYQYIPIARADFGKVSNFGQKKLRTCIVLKPRS